MSDEHPAEFIVGRPPPLNVPQRRLAVLVAFSGDGGVERMMANLIDGFIGHGVQIDLLLILRPGMPLPKLDLRVNVIRLSTRHSSLAAPAVARYLRRHRPEALLAAKDRAIRSAVLARRLAGTDTRIVGRLGTNLSAALEGRGSLRRWLRCQPMRWLYRSVDRVITVSQGVATDTLALTGLPEERVEVIRNPVITPQLEGLRQVDAPHPWFGTRDRPLILGVGRLTRQKDFATLLEAFARLRRARPCRLVILGEGSLRRTLEEQAERLGITEDVDLPGYTGNPYAYMARADLFVLSSRWEGSPNVLTEALAVGTPVVATDCPSGPREILQDGRYGKLVPMANAAAMADAMAESLERRLASDILQQAVAEYTAAQSSERYLRALGLVD